LRNVLGESYTKEHKNFNENVVENEGGVMEERRYPLKHTAYGIS
jgi:hypothetical protein